MHLPNGIAPIVLLLVNSKLATSSLNDEQLRVAMQDMQSTLPYDEMLKVPVQEGHGKGGDTATFSGESHIRTSTKLTNTAELTTPNTLAWVTKRTIYGAENARKQINQRKSRILT